MSIPDAKFTPLAIVGMGCLFPKADGLEAYWANIKNGVDAITEIPPSHWRPEDYFDADPKRTDHTYGRRGGFLEPVAFDPLKYGIAPNAIEATDTAQLLGMIVAERALRDAGYDERREFDRRKFSVILGVTGALELVIPLGARLGHPVWKKALREAGVDCDVVEDVSQRIARGYVEWQEASFPGLLGNVVAGRISKYLDLGGTNCVVDAACASSLSALHLAALELASGKADAVVTGGVDTFNDIFMYMCFSKTPALSPTGHARPFDHQADGTTLGEGLGVMVLKRLADAERDGDRVYAVVKGIGSSSDGKGDAIYAPVAAGQEKALREAYANAGVTPDTIELIEAHGTGTKRGDAVEVSALTKVYGEAADGKAPWCAIGSVKSQIGHTKAAAGAAGLIKAALALHHKVLPPTAKVEKPQDAVAPGVTPFYVNTIKRPWLPRDQHPRRAGVSSFGFGGSNFHCVLEEYKSEKAAPEFDGSVQIVALSGANAAALQQQLRPLLAASGWSQVRDIAFASRAAFDTNAHCRLALVLERSADWTKTINDAVQGLNESTSDAWSTPSGAFYGTGKAEGVVAVLFPGQGAQYVGMLRTLACTFPQMLDTLATFDCAYESDTGTRLIDYIYPHPAFDDATTRAQEDALQATHTAQPALGAVELGAWRVLEHFGVRAGAFAGHSYGELVALCAAGRYDVKALARLSIERGRLMAGDGSDLGSMFAVRADAATVQRIIDADALDLIVANHNAPNQVVLSGATAEIARAEKALKAQGLRGTRLQVAAAFHSPLVADAATPFRHAVGNVVWNESATKVYANTTGDAYPVNASDAADLLANQLARPIAFVGQIEQMYSDGVRTFVEAGPGARLTGLVSAILGERPHRAVALDPSNGRKDGMADLARTLAQLAADGRTVALREWDAAHTPAPAPDGKPRFTVSLTGANYRDPKKAPPLPQREMMSKSVDSPEAVTARPQITQIVADDAARANESRPKSGSTMQKRDAQPVRSEGIKSGLIADILRQTDAHLDALRQMQASTAELHRQFLTGQEQAAQRYHALLQQQEAMLARFAEGGGQVATAARIEPAPVRRPAVTAAAVNVTRPVAEPAQDDALARALLALVSEKTGYPVEMLTLDMALDADLGIDSIKRVEILSALQEQMPELPSVDGEELGKLQT
ncbi:MAG: beta-ketoacyl synthase N-terminal-like domain-containing protein, partial [Candidatus Hydrogenedentales bacterium]